MMLTLPHMQAVCATIVLSFVRNTLELDLVQAGGLGCS